MSGLSIAGGGGRKLAAAMMRKTAAQSIDTGTDVTLTWETTVYDTLGIIAEPASDRFKVPSGYSFARVSAMSDWEFDGTAGVRFISVIKSPDGSQPYVATYYGFMEATQAVPPSGGLHRWGFTSPWFSVVAGECFKAIVFQDSLGPLNILSSYSTWFAVEFAN
jgi:hypothetical protein